MASRWWPANAFLMSKPFINDRRLLIANAFLMSAIASRRRPANAFLTSKPLFNDKAAHRQCLLDERIALM
jgi:hypothetical protein